MKDLVGISTLTNAISTPFKRHFNAIFTIVFMLEDLMAKLAGSITKDRPLDFILYTGDSPPHDIWAHSRSKNLKSVHAVTGYFTRYFPGVPVLSALGNHEAFPVDQYQGVF